MLFKKCHLVKDASVICGGDSQFKHPQVGSVVRSAYAEDYIEHRIIIWATKPKFVPKEHQGTNCTHDRVEVRYVGRLLSIRYPWLRIFQVGWIKLKILLRIPIRSDEVNQYKERYMTGVLAYPGRTSDELYLGDGEYVKKDDFVKAFNNYKQEHSK